MGLDILASNLSRDKRLLEKSLQKQQEAHRAQEAALKEWKKLCETKDKKLTKQNEQIEELMLAQAQMEEEIERKRREVEEQVNKERASLEARVEALQLECDEA